MKEIDFIYKNFDPHAFSINLKNAKSKYKKEEFNFLEDVILDSVRDIDQLKYEINHSQFSNSNNHVFDNFVKKYKNNYTDNDIKKYFFETNNILNTRGKDRGDVESLLGVHLECGEFFRYFKKDFDITFYGQVTYTKHTHKDPHKFGIFRDYYCLYIKNIKKYYLFFFQHCSRAMEMEFTQVAKIFSQKPKSSELINILKRGDKATYPDKKEIIVKQYKIFTYSKSYNRIYKEGYNLKHQTKPHFKNEEDYFNYHNTKGERYFAQKMAISNPEKYFTKHFKSWKQVSWILGGSSSPGYRRSKIRGKFKGDSFFKFVMSNRFNYRNSTKFIEDIIYSYDDLEGLLDYVPKKIQEGKSLKEEIRILRLFRGNNKKFIIKVFHTNKDKLEDLVKNYMPSTIFNDVVLMNELIKLDINFTADIGEKLKKNKKFMSRVNKLLKN